ncbi:aminobenzoyl-glutamate utilization protein A [Marinococcus luteus]|uniref:Aminobenzoyl-glutamate utilization protein A n=1 Tax=Marinococcus luteus TaxID=1122204 RepID=A0A1H2XRE3_9BACI|nr:amidohydrolase [Marinococcus luteus]SDW94899.1 aminobenzoyl-glutamate utilization protein A [Marinococcus luteus]
MSVNKIDEYIQKLLPKLKEWRRHFHKYPEVGWTEIYTTYVIAQELQQLDGKVIYGKELTKSDARQGVPDKSTLKKAKKRAEELQVPEEFIKQTEDGHTGALIQFEGKEEGPHVCYRVDIDALPITETSAASHFPNRENFASAFPGEMHACAHDGHITLGLGLATFLSEHPEEWNGKATIIFQPAEEGSRGAKAVVANRWLDDVDYFMSGHIGITDMKVGTIAATAAKFLATTKFDVIFKGVSSHAGAKPEEGGNALLAAAAAAVHTQGISRHSKGDTRINIGELNAGSGRNVVADYAKIIGETRGSSTQVNQYMMNEAARMIEASAFMYGVESQIEYTGEGMAAECDSEWQEWIASALEKSSLVKYVEPSREVGASEDATVMINHVQKQGGKATYMLFGTELAAGHHHPSFDYEEAVFGPALAAFIYPLVNSIWKEEEN